MRMAIVGCGGLGGVHADCYARMSDVTLVGVCDIEEERGRQMAEKVGCPAYTSFQDMLERSACDAVSITLPSDLHTSYAIQAAEAGKHVICEKPIALTLEDAAAMIDACERNGVRLFIGHVVRFFPEYAQMKSKVDDGSLGRIGVAHAKRIGAHPGAARSWYLDSGKSGGVVADLMIHDIDFMRWALGEVKSVYGLRKCGDGIDYATATLVFASGAIANLEAYWGYPGPFTTAAELAGSAGVISCDSAKAKSLHIRKAASDESGGRTVDVPQSPGYRSPFELELRHFVDCIRDGREPLVSAHDAYKALEIAKAVIESAQSGKVVYLADGQEGLA